MATEIYKGRKIVTRVKRSSVGREVVATVNGKYASSTHYCSGAEAKVLDNVRCNIDFIDQEPVNGARWGAEWYDPKTIELCPEGLHAQEIDGTCKHPSCVKKDALPKIPCPKCGTPAGRYTPIACTSLWVVAHRPEESRKVCEASNLPA